MTDPRPESALEEFFMWAIEKYIAPDVRYTCQVPVKTDYGPFRLDVVLSTVDGNRAIAVELDGAAFHDSNEQALNDVLRDTAILREYHVDAIVRVPGRYLKRYREQTLWLLAQMEPWTISERGHTVLRQQMRQVQNVETRVHSWGMDLTFDEDLTEDDVIETPWDGFAVLTRHSKLHPTVRRIIGLIDEHPHHTLNGLKDYLR